MALLRRDALGHRPAAAPISTEVAPTGARTILDRLLTQENVAIERDFFATPEHHSVERAYGWVWLLTLAHELATWEDPDGRRWSVAVAPTR
ncbi:MAG: DUF2891 domain-containing protein [Chloroflexota bacterium]|nr:DUF2891 domain-containing protein [Chloroflexota bacterium]